VFLSGFLVCFAPKTPPKTVLFFISICYKDVAPTALNDYWLLGVGYRFVITRTQDVAISCS